MFPKRYILILIITLLFFPSMIRCVQAAPLFQEDVDYVVQSGDTLASIAVRFLGDAGRYTEIVSVTNQKNAVDATYARIENPAIIEVGWKLFLPADTSGTESMDVSPVEPSSDPEPLLLTNGEDIIRGKIAFSLYNPGREVYEVQIVTVDGTERWIVTDEQSISEPALSPDGTRIAVRGWDRYRGIQSFDLYGKNQANVSFQLEDSKPDWGSGGGIVLGSQRESDRRWRLYENSSESEWEFMNQDNLVESIIGEDPAWAPDDGFVVYRGCDFSLNRCGLRTVARGGAQPQILTVESSDTSPDWSPDGKMILFMSERSGNWDIYTLPVDEQGRAIPNVQPTQVTADASNEMLPVWSPWGNAIAFVSDRSGAWAIYIMRPDGSDVRQIADIGGTYDPPLWAPEIAGRGVTNEQISWSQ